MLKGVLAIAFSLAAGRGTVVLAGILISRSLGADAFAVFTFAHITATSMSNIATLGMQNALPRYFARLEVDTGVEALSGTVMALLWAGTGLAVMTFAVVALPREITGIPEPTTKFVLAVLLITVGANNLSIGAANGLERYSHLAVAALVQGSILLAGACLAVYAARIGFVLWGYALATLAAFFILLSNIVRQFSRRLRAQAIVLNRVCARDVAQFCGPLLLSGILTNSGLWLSGRSLLGEDGGIGDFAEFSLGLQWFGLASLASGVIARVVLPRLTRFAFQRNGTDSQTTIVRGALVSAVAALAVLIGTVAFSGQILSLYGPELIGAKHVLWIFVGAALLASPIDVISSALIAKNHQTTLFFVVLAWWLVLMISVALLNHAGSFGVATAVAISYAAYLLCVTAAGHLRGILFFKNRND